MTSVLWCTIQFYMSGYILTEWGSSDADCARQPVGLCSTTWECRRNICPTLDWLQVVCWKISSSTSHLAHHTASSAFGPPDRQVQRCLLTEERVTNRKVKRYGTRRLVTDITKAGISQYQSVHIFEIYSSKIHFNITLPPIWLVQWHRICHIRDIPGSIPVYVMSPRWGFSVALAPLD